MATLPAVVKPRPQQAIEVKQPVVIAGNALTVLDAAIAHVQADAAALERARAIVARLQA